ncbi:hypothetical protein [Alicyclobacillus acidocaldarius]|uniref:Uncharacterized protein n=1 Tax=Alicyclobacillus acidocaldarius subsp. acidocaldarius (strain ATCC 27009 / DSM 446 / BCRC 14685 / JCM 5260 / KCTC 1825 / NBRC 15652 / NCIMB 11725 / NRRL B-14509 / 104-IA) TaxID=521098 RepID=C8WVX8_ALIAD|nr:hypothetical protein [Alicyclobacillus acidocaldarius]ACV58250.1 hypothetical protein Aaci_1221 [Alicyclobacillus acidocaldarius subsp. acidocaldarius DSM 446]
MGAFGGYTRWAVVFLVIFVLFFLLVPAGVGVYHTAPAPAPVATVAYTEYDEVIETGPMYGYAPHHPMAQGPVMHEEYHEHYDADESSSL